MSKIIKVEVLIEVSEEVASIIKYDPNLVEASMIMDVGYGKIEKRVLDLSIPEYCNINVTKQEMTY